MNEEKVMRNEYINKPKAAEDDRVIAPMNVEGMPWYTPGKPLPRNPSAEPLSNHHLWRYTFSAVGTALLILSAFGLTGAAFIWFCVNVWFR